MSHLEIERREFFDYDKVTRRIYAEAKKLSSYTFNIAVMSAELMGADHERKGISFLVEDQTWIKAFEVYNKANEKQLSMQCSPCYVKVLQYLISQKYGA